MTRVFELPKPDYETAALAISYIIGTAIKTTVQRCTEWYEATVDNGSAVGNFDIPRTYIPSITRERLWVGNETTDNATLASRVDRATAFLAAEQGDRSPIDPAVRERALGTLVNIRTAVRLADPAYHLREPIATFSEYRNALIQLALQREGGQYADLDAQLRHQTEVLAGGQLAAEAYALAALEQ
jgi:hypothetical protein